jgi:hypothetical protein
MRSDRDTIRQTVDRLRASSKPPVFSRSGTPQLTTFQRRQLDPSNHVSLSNAVRHLTYHVYPRRDAEESWRWNLEQIKDRQHLFNGLKVTSVNYDQHTVCPDTLIKVSEQIGVTWDHVEARRNDPGLGEVQAWNCLLDRLRPENAAENEVVFSAHAKGVKYGGCPPLIRNWADLMYQANLDHPDLVRQQLEWCVATGAFRAKYRVCYYCKNGWYYSGAFWWWRLHDIAKLNTWKDTGNNYAGRELWIGNQISREDAGCLFLDNSRSPYLESFWNAKVWPKWEEFKNAQRSI